MSLLRTLILTLFTLTSSVAVPSLAQDAVDAGYARLDPAKVVTAERCGECHITAFETWQESRHAQGFETDQQKADADEIAGKMGVKLIRRESLCLQCHFTAVIKRDQLRSTSGISCESCHGAARDWIDVHSNYGGEDLDRSTESAEHRSQRHAQIDQAGMIRPSELYDVVTNCYQCHIVPNEQLVEVGGHSAGSAFDFLERSEEIRHNFLESYLVGDGTANAAVDPQRKRLMYVVAWAIDLEHTYRALAGAEGRGLYWKSLTRRTRGPVGEFAAMAEVVTTPEIAEILGVGRATKASAASADQLIAAADGVADAVHRFLDDHDGSQLAALDELMPEP